MSSLENIKNSLELIVNEMHKYNLLIENYNAAHRKTSLLSGEELLNNNNYILSLDKQINELKPLMNLIRMFHYCSKNLPNLD